MNNLFPTSFFVWRPAANAYLYYIAIYDTDGNVVRIKPAEPPNGIRSVHHYMQPFVHVISMPRPGPHHLKFYDLVERSCIRIVQHKLTATGHWTYEEREVPIMEPETHAILPRVAP